MRPERKLMCAIFATLADEGFQEEVNGVSLRDALMEALDDIQHSRLLGQRFKQRYKRVILLRFGFESPDGRGKTLEQVAMEFDVTRERIRQIEAETLRLLRHPCRSRKLKEFIREGEGM